MCSPSNGAEVAICSPCPMNGKSSLHQLATPTIIIVRPRPLNTKSPKTKVPPWDINALSATAKSGNPIKNNITPRQKIIGDAEP